MRLCTLAPDDGHRSPRLGVVEGEEVADVSAVAPSLACDVGTVLANGALDVVAAALATAPRLDASAVALAAPVTRPPKFLAIGLNYAAHIAESNMERPEHQVWFNKQTSCVIGPGEAIEVPSVSSLVDWEGELAFVIGRRCRHVPASRAYEVVAGFTVANDVSVRDWQWQVPTWTMGKSFDTHGPLGPVVVTLDELGDPHDLGLRTYVNGELRQDGRTDDLIFDCWQMVEHLSTAFTLEPGDVISTGTPAGCGFSLKPPQWLADGDTVRVEIEGIGTLENPVVDEVPTTKIEEAP